MGGRSGISDATESVVVAEAPSGVVLFSSTVPDATVGRSLSELGRIDAFRVFHGDGRPYQPGDWPLVRSLATGETVEGEELFWVAQDGDRHSLRVSSYPVFDGEGTMVAAVSVARDVSAEGSYLAYHSSLFEAVDDAVVGTDPSFRLTVWNRGAERLYGYTADEVLGREAREIASYSGDTSRAEVERELRETDRTRSELTAQRKDGTEVDVELISVAVRDEDGQLAGYLGIHRDISERRRAEQQGKQRALHQGLVADLGLRALAADDLHSVLEDAVVTTARGVGVPQVAIAELLPADEGLVLRAGVGWSEGALGTARGGAGESLGGYTITVGQPVVSEDLEADSRFRLSPLLRSHAPASAATVVIAGREAPYGVLGAFSPVRRSFTADEVHFLQAVANVISAAVDRERSELQIVEAREAERRRIARDLHDEALQNLTVALARATALARGAVDEEGAADVDELVGALRRAGQQVRGAVYDLRLGAEGHRPLRELLAELVEVQQRLAPEQRIELRVGEHVPDTLGGTAVSLLRVAGEALANARRYAGAEIIRVEVWCADGDLCLKVADGGRGIEPGADAWPGASGIVGMRERAELLGGDLAVQSAPGEGTEVIFRLPLAEGAPAAGPPVRVLLVEDHASVRQAIAAMFAREPDFGVVHQAGSLAAAREQLRDVDVAVVDLALPDGHGADLIRELRAVNPAAHALALSATLDRAELARAVESGAAGALDKSTGVGELIAAVRRVRAGETLLPLAEVVELLRFAGKARERHYEQRQAIERLSPRELEVLQLLAEGLESAEIAARLHITVRTERNHVSNILGKLGVHSRLQAVVFAVRTGVVEIRDRG